MITQEKAVTPTFGNELISKLESIAGRNNVISDAEGLYAYSFDCAHVPFSKNYPRVVVFPQNTGQVSEILKLAQEKNAK